MLSARNQFKGTVKEVKLGNVMAEVVISAGGIEIVSAITRKGTPSSPAACHREPGGADSRASRNRWAASRVCTAGQRLDPSPT